jgi:hypothetical protein
MNRVTRLSEEVNLQEVADDCQTIRMEARGGVGAQFEANLRQQRPKTIR